MANQALPEWRRSSFCSTGACVEVAKTNTNFLVRDSKDPNSPVLAFTEDEWTAFISGVTAGEFTLE